MVLLAIISGLQGQGALGQEEVANEASAPSGEEAVQQQAGQDGRIGDPAANRRARSPRRLDRDVEVRMEGSDLFNKNGVAYRKKWGFKSGVVTLYPPYYDGWENGKEVRGLYEKYASKRGPGQFLASIFYNKRFYRQTGSEFVNNFVLLWVIDQYAYSVLSPSNFDAYKTTVKEDIIEARKGYADRERFDSFEDYIAFKFGRDEEMEAFVDGYWIVAYEDDQRLTYFYTSEFIGEEKRSKQAFIRPLIATTSYILLQNKLIAMDVVREYDGQDDIPILMEFTSNLYRDLQLVNRFEGSRSRSRSRR